MTYNGFIDILRQFIYKTVDPALKAMMRVGITPNIITLTGFIFNIVAAAIFIYAGTLYPSADMSCAIGWGGFTVLFAGLFDMMDGRMARIGHLESAFGALWDSSLDRYSEMFCLFGITFLFLEGGDLVSGIVTFTAMIGSVMVSYIRARAEGLGIECKVGMLQRTERVVITAAGALLTGIFSQPLCLIVAMWIIAVFANFTAFQRIAHCRKAKSASPQLSTQEREI